MKYEIKEIPFNGSTLLGVRDTNGQVWLGVKKTCLDIGLTEGQARKQVENIQREDVLKPNCRPIAIVQTEGTREVKREQLFINEKVVTLWLAKITLTESIKKKSPLAYNKLIKYQLEASDVLHKAFYETEDQKAAFNEMLGLQGEMLDLKQEVKELKELVVTVIDNSTINKAQQNALYNLAKERICFLLGGKSTKEYKRYNKLYFQNLWGDVKRKFDCSGSYHDLNPKDFKAVKEFIPSWEFTG